MPPNDKRVALADHMRSGCKLALGELLQRSICEGGSCAAAFIVHGVTRAAESPEKLSMTYGQRFAKRVEPLTKHMQDEQTEPEPSSLARDPEQRTEVGPRAIRCS